VSAVKEGGREISHSPGVKIVEMKNGIVKMELTSGHYIFEVINAHK
jgi:hypothetical protein